MIKKKIDALGRIVLPKGILLQLNWEKGDEIGFFADVEGGFLQIRKVKSACVACGAKEDLVPIKGNTFLCRTCLRNLINREEGQEGKIHS